MAGIDRAAAATAIRGTVTECAVVTTIAAAVPASPFNWAGTAGIMIVGITAAIAVTTAKDFKR